MNVLLINGSPHKNGTTALLADQFIQGAEEAGHTIWRLDAAFADIHPCLGCDKCRSGQHECVWQDDMRALYPKLLEADMLVFVTPVYYHGASAQIKVAIDRFHGIDDLLRQRPKKAILLAVAADTKDHVLRGVTATYEETLLLTLARLRPDFGPGLLQPGRYRKDRLSGPGICFGQGGVSGDG